MEERLVSPHVSTTILVIFRNRIYCLTSRTKVSCRIGQRGEGAAHSRQLPSPPQHTYCQSAACPFPSAAGNTPKRSVMLKHSSREKFLLDSSLMIFPESGRWSVHYLRWRLRFTVIQTESFKQLYKVQLCCVGIPKDSAAQISITLWMNSSDNNQGKLKSPWVLFVAQDFSSGLKHICALLTVIPLLCHSMGNKLANIKWLSASKCSVSFCRKPPHIVYVSVFFKLAFSWLNIPFLFPSKVGWQRCLGKSWCAPGFDFGVESGWLTEGLPV